jgi:hypothetical protein
VEAAAAQVLVALVEMPQAATLTFQAPQALMDRLMGQEALAQAGLQAVATLM